MHKYGKGDLELERDARFFKERFIIPKHLFGRFMALVLEAMLEFLKDGHRAVHPRRVTVFVLCWAH